jgi:hypothetical protein
MTKKSKLLFDITIQIPDCIDIGTVEVFKMPPKFKPKRIGIDSDDSEEYDSESDEDYLPPSVEESDEDIYDSLPFTESEKQELKDELEKLILDQEDMV